MRGVGGGEEADSAGGLGAGEKAVGEVARDGAVGDPLAGGAEGGESAVAGVEPFDVRELAEERGWGEGFAVALEMARGDGRGVAGCVHNGGGEGHGGVIGRIGAETLKDGGEGEGDGAHEGHGGGACKDGLRNGGFVLFNLGAQRFSGVAIAQGGFVVALFGFVFRFAQRVRGSRWFTRESQRTQRENAENAEEDRGETEKRCAERE